MAKAKNEKKKEVKIASPPKGEETQRQATGELALLFAAFQGYGKPPFGFYRIYRQMRRNPTVALARSLATAPIKTSPWRMAAKDDVQDDRKDFIEEQVKKFWPRFILDVVFALDYGWMAFEKVWEIDSQGKLVYKKLKPLLVDITKVKVDKVTGIFEGMQNKGVYLEPNKCFIYTYDGEAGNFHGRSRHENIRATAWHFWDEVSKRAGQYSQKVAGVIPIIEYPVGESKDKDGVKTNNFELAQRVLENLGRGNGVAMPNTMAQWAGDLARSGIDISELRAWHIKFLETKGNHGRDFVVTQRHLESLILRGWLVPERAGTEGQFGTKAEATVHSEHALVEAELTYEDILRFVNWYIINPLLVYNYGKEAENSIWLEAAGLDPKLKEFYRKIIEGVLTKPQNIDLLLSWCDINALLDSVEMPKAEEVIEPVEKVKIKSKQPPEETEEGEEKTKETEAGLLAGVKEYFRKRRQDAAAK